MRIVFHLGAHCTDEDRLVRCLLKNRGVLAQEGIAVPSPNRYRPLLRATLDELQGAAATPERQALLIDQIMDTDQAERLILSWDSFLSFPPWAVQGTLYRAAGDRSHGLARIFADHEVEFHLALRNPATFLPALQQVVSTKSQRDILAGVDHLALAWSDVVRQIRRFNPGVPLTVWCDEDTPLIWPEVLQAVSGHGAKTALVGTDELLSMIMNDIGLSRMKAYCIEHPPQTVAQRRRIVTAFLERFARPEKVEVDIPVPGWTDDYVAEMTALYLQDVERIRQLPGVTLIEA